MNYLLEEESTLRLSAARGSIRRTSSNVSHRECLQGNHLEGIVCLQQGSMARTLGRHKLLNPPPLTPTHPWPKQYVCTYVHSHLHT